MRSIFQIPLVPGVFVLLMALFSPPLAAEGLLFRISTENTPNHVQTQTVQRFADELQRRAGNRLTVRYHHSAGLFRDRDVIHALNAGRAEMAVPGSWQLDRFEPYVSLLMLPVFFGRDLNEHHRIRDGRIGQVINERLSDSIRVVVPGRWIDLGHAHLYFTDRTVESHSQMAGLHIRIAGGSANADRIEAVKGVPVIIAWPDLPAALENEQIDGLLSTHESVASARLWRYGVRYALETEDYFAQYIPIISRSFWDRLPEDLQEVIRQSWESIVDDARVAAANAQTRARHVLLDHGINVTRPSPAQLDAWRREIMRLQADAAARLDLPQDLLDRLMTYLDEPG